MSIDCHAGHVSHDRIRLNIDISNHRVPDYPRIASQPIVEEFQFEVFDYNKYKDFNGYCMGQDEVSNSLIINGIWEGFETALWLDILKKHKHMVLDFGCHIGWYSILAAKAGNTVMAFDAISEHLDVLMINANLNSCVNSITCNHMWLDENSAKLTIPDRVSVMKCDIEASDKHAIAMCSDLFAVGKIDFVLLEVSPTFCKDYGDLVDRIIELGYDAYMVPSKGFQYIEEFSNSPLQTLVSKCEIPVVGRRQFVNSLQQENFLFIRHEVNDYKDND